MKATIAVLLVLGSTVAHADSSPYRYTVISAEVTDLGTLGGTSSAAFDINDAGNVVGWAHNLLDQERATLFYADGRRRNIGAGFIPNESQAYGINNLNQVVGHVFDLGDEAWHAFRWSSGGLVMLNETGPDPDEVETGSSAYAIADSGQIAGVRIFNIPGVGGVHERTQAAVIWRDEHDYTTLSTEYATVAIDVNSSNVAVGPGREPIELFRWRIVGGAVRSAIIRCPPTEGRVYAAGDLLGINEHGVMVGFCNDHADGRDNLRAFVRHGSAPRSQELGVPPTGTFSIAEDINGAEFITGSGNVVDTLPGGPSVTTNIAFLYHRDFGFYRLPAPAADGGIEYCRGKALNDRNAVTRTIQVAGTCKSRSGYTRAVRWSVRVSRHLRFR